MPFINWAAIDWVSLVALSLLVLFVAHVGERLSVAFGPVLAALLFAVGFAVWSYGLGDVITQAVAVLSTTTPRG